VVGVPVNRPVREEHVGPLGFDQTSKFVVVGAIDDGVRVALWGEDWAGFQNLARFPGFGYADVGGGLFRSFGTAFLASIQVQDHYFVALIGVSRDGSSAAVFGIARVASGHYHFEFLSERQRGSAGQDVSARELHSFRMTDFAVLKLRNARRCVLAGSVFGVSVRCCGRGRDSHVWNDGCDSIWATGNRVPYPSQYSAASEVEKMKSVGTIYTTSLNIPPQDFQQGFPGVSKRFEWFAIDYAGKFWIPKPGVYHFALTSDDGSKLYIDDDLVVDDDGQHPPVTESASVILSGGIHRIRVAYFQGPRFHVALQLQVAREGEELRIFSTDEFKPPPNPETWEFPERKPAARR